MCGRGKKGKGKWGHVSGGDWRVAFTKDCTVGNGFARKSRKGSEDPSGQERVLSQSQNRTNTTLKLPPLILQLMYSVTLALNTQS